MEGRWKGNGNPCISVGDKDQVEVKILKGFNGVQYIEKAVGASRKGVILQLGIRERC
jgi:hypothetical protein